MNATAANPPLVTAIIVVSAVVLYLILAAAGARFVERVRQRTPGSAARVATLWVMVRRVILIVIVVLVILMVVDRLGPEHGSFLAVSTAIAAALGFGAQNLVRDVIAGFFILAEDQYRIGDTVTIAATTGKVEDIQFRVTVLRDGEGNVHYVPNGQITVSSNLTSLYASPSIDVRVGYQADVDHAMEVMLDELARMSADPSVVGHDHQGAADARSAGLRRIPAC